MININYDKAKEISHDIRRKERATEFKKWDDEIYQAMTLPEAIIQKKTGMNKEAYLSELETTRQEIRDRHASYQEQIDGAINVEELETTINEVLNVRQNPLSQ